MKGLIRNAFQSSVPITQTPERTRSVCRWKMIAGQCARPDYFLQVNPRAMVENTRVFYCIHPYKFSINNKFSFNNNDNSTTAGKVKKGDIKYGQSE